MEKRLWSYIGGVGQHSWTCAMPLFWPSLSFINNNEHKIFWSLGLSERQWWAMGLMQYRIHWCYARVLSYTLMLLWISLLEDFYVMCYQSSWHCLLTKTNIHHIFNFSYIPILTSPSLSLVLWLSLESLTSLYHV